jgi:creatinine amidohydrolase
MDHAADFRSTWREQEPKMTLLTPEGSIGFGWETQDLHPAGALGNAAAATAALGAAILDHQAARLATLLEEVRRFDLDNWMRAAPLPHDKPADRD